MDQARGGDLLCNPQALRPETHGRIGLEDPTGDQPDPVHREQDRPGDRASPAAEVRSHSVREEQAEQPGHDEVGTLHPPVLAVGEQADRVPSQVKARGSESVPGPS